MDPIPCPKCKTKIEKHWLSGKVGNVRTISGFCPGCRKMVYLGKSEESINAGGGGKEETPAPKKAAAKKASGKRKHKAAAPAGGGPRGKQPAGRVPAGSDIPEPKSRGIAKSLREFFDF